MKKNIFLYILFYIIKKCLTYIVYPLYIYDELNQIENYLSFNSTYTTLEIGYPPQKVNFYFSLDHNKMNLTDINCKENNLLDIESSQTIGIMGFPDEDEDSYSSKIFAVDEISFYDNINLTKKEKQDKCYLYYYADLNKDDNYVCGSIGISIIKYKEDNEDDDIEYYLKYLRAQNKFFSFLHYNNQDFFVNNIFLNQEFKDIFEDIKNISWINPIIMDNSLHWEIYMKEIYYNNTHIKGNIIFELNPLFELIIGSNEYKNNILRDFFNLYINNEICLINIIQGYQIIECDANKFGIKDIKKFPDLYMFNTNLNHIFEMIGEEIFIRLDNKYYFAIIFLNENSENNKWLMGKIFMRKYPVIFSPINRLVGFYINPNGDTYMEKEDSEKKEKKEEPKSISQKPFTRNIYFYLEIVIIALIFTCLGLWIGRKIFIQRKRKLNELIDDYYQYESESKKSINEKEKIKGKNTYTSIEMNTRIKEKE